MLSWKIGITTQCGAKCLTCPCHLQPPRTMGVSQFCSILDWIEGISTPADGGFQFNSVGDVLCLPNAREYLDRMAKCQRHTSLTTNGLYLNEMPPVTALVISFNGGTLEAHHKVTGLDSERVLKNIRRLYPQMKGRHVEIHCLICDLNAGTEQNLLTLFDGFPGRIRVSYKCENQRGQDHTLPGYRKAERVPCDYLDTVVVDTSGKIIQCSHDFAAVTDFGMAGFGNLKDVGENLNRRRVIWQHWSKMYKGLCEHCNYNVPVTDQVWYLK